MFITDVCPQWFWLIPLFGMVLMFGACFLSAGRVCDLDQAVCVVVAAPKSLAIRNAVMMRKHHYPIGVNSGRTVMRTS